MARSALLIAALVCVLIVSIDAHTLRDTIFTESHRCCVSSCSSLEREVLENQMNAYDAQGNSDAHAVRNYYEKSASGATCAGHSKRTNSASVRAPYGPFDVQFGDVVFNATFSLTIDGGIYYSYIYATVSFNGSSSTVYPTDYYYSNDGTNKTTVTKNVTFTIPKYSLPGNWTITGYGYGPNYATYTAAYATFNVARTKNDVEKPRLTGVSAPVMNINDVDLLLSVFAADDLSGITSIQVYIGNSTATVAYGSWNAPYVNNKPAGLVSVNAALSLYNYSVIAVGTYDITTLYIYDAIGNYRYYYNADLVAAGFQSSITFAAGFCNAGRKLGYMQTGRCTLCDKGTFSNYGAFRCRACLAGSASNIAGASACTQCPPGTAGIGGSAGCDICPAGTYTSSFGNAECMPCAPGYNSTEGSDYCSPCPQGTYSAGGTASCLPCPAGSAGGANFYCAQCTPGTFMATTGALQCMSCPMGTFSWVGATSCTSCPSDMPKGPAGSNSRLNCYA